MLQVVAQHHQVMHFSIHRVLGFPKEHLMKEAFAGLFVCPDCPAFWAFLRRFHKLLFACFAVVLLRISAQKGRLLVVDDDIRRTPLQHLCLRCFVGQALRNVV